MKAGIYIPRVVRDYHDSIEDVPWKFSLIDPSKAHLVLNFIKPGTDRLYAQGFLNAVECVRIVFTRSIILRNEDFY